MYYAVYMILNALFYMYHALYTILHYFIADTILHIM